MIETSISVAAAVHVAIAKSDVITKVDLDGPSLCAFDPVDGGVNFNESEISASDAPGLGIREGDYVLAVNGRPLDTQSDPWAAFQGLALVPLAAALVGWRAIRGERQAPGPGGG